MHSDYRNRSDARHVLSPTRVGDNSHTHKLECRRSHSDIQLRQTDSMEGHSGDATVAGSNSVIASSWPRSVDDLTTKLNTKVTDADDVNSDGVNYKISDTGTHSNSQFSVP